MGTKNTKNEKRSRSARITADSLTADERLTALCRAANAAGISYGKYCAHISDEEKEKIYVEYADELEKKRKSALKQKKNLKTDLKTERKKTAE